MLRYSGALYASFERLEVATVHVVLACARAYVSALS